MSESTSFPGGDSSAPDSVVSSVHMSAGELLRATRESAGLHIAALAVALKIPVRKLELLEADRYDELPGAVFTRALASSVCRHLKIDPQQVLARLPASHAPALATDNGGLDPFRSPGASNNNSAAQQISRPIVVIVLILLLGALVLIFMPSINRGDSIASTVANVVSSQADTTPAPAPPIAPMTSGNAPQETFAPPEPGSVATPAAGTPATPATTSANTAISSSTTNAAPNIAATPAPKASAAVGAVPVPPVPQVASTGLVTFTASGQSWVEVTDSKGQVTLQTTLSAGQSAGASGALPLKVIVGRADLTKVDVRGKPFDVTPYLRDNVARFEVK